MHRSRLVSVAIVVMTAVSSTGVFAQNLLVNPDFDTDLAGWDGPAVWDPADAFGSPSSGSATWINDYAGGGSTIVRQCVALEPWIEGSDSRKSPARSRGWPLYVEETDPDCLRSGCCSADLGRVHRSRNPAGGTRRSHRNHYEGP